MYICSEHDGDDIAHEGYECPACKQVQSLQDEIKDLEQDKETLQSENDSLMEEVADLENQLDSEGE